KTNTKRFLYFFFSSRRRHTRFSRDWSSDVCSSDLWTSALHRFASSSAKRNAVSEACEKSRATRILLRLSMSPSSIVGSPPREVRSEERRVGTESIPTFGPCLLASGGEETLHAELEF